MWHVLGLMLAARDVGLGPSRANVDENSNVLGLKLTSVNVNISYSHYMCCIIIYSASYILAH